LRYKKSQAVCTLQTKLRSCGSSNAIADGGSDWLKPIKNVVKSVVSIHFCQTCSFDTDVASASEATGFVVDAEKGYILTNRRVVCAGPSIGYWIFDNNEECDIHED
jgi:S1-C subfamily serine protease